MIHSVCTISHKGNSTLFAIVYFLLKIKEYEVSKSHNEKEIRSLDSELRTLQAKVKEMEEKDLRAKLDSVKRIEDLEEQKRKQEAENDHLNSSKELLKKRHAEEMKTTENSHRFADILFQIRQI